MRSSQTKTVRKTRKTGKTRKSVAVRITEFHHPDAERVEIIVAGADAALRKSIMTQILQAVKIVMPES